MSQRNPMNERYTTEKHAGTTRKSAASAKPKTKAAATVTMGTSKKTPQQRKAEQKAARKAEQERQRELDRKYYKPDTERFKKLKRIWWASLAGAIVCTILSWVFRNVQPTWISFICLFGAYALIIFAFYLDFSKIRKERRAYQERMVALEEAQSKKERKQQARMGGHAKDEPAAAEAAEESADVTDAPQSKPSFASRLFGKKKSAQAATEEAADA